MTAKRQTKKSLIEKILAYPDYNGTWDPNGLSMKELRDILKLAEAGLTDLTDVSAEKIDAVLNPAPVVDTTLSDTAEKLTKAVETIYEEAKATAPEAEPEQRETISIHDVMDAAAETYLAERAEKAEALFGETTAAALKRATELQALKSPLALTPAGKYIRTYNVEGAYVTNDGNWIAVKDEKGAAEKKPWTLYEVAGGTLREVGRYKSSATAFDPEVEVFAAWFANQAAA